MSKSFEDLEVWKRACRQAIEVYNTLKEVKDYGIKGQMERAAVSVPSSKQKVRKGTPNLIFNVSSESPKALTVN